MLDGQVQMADMLDCTLDGPHFVGMLDGRWQKSAAQSLSGEVARPQTHMSATCHQGTPAATVRKTVPAVATVLQSTILCIAIIRLSKTKCPNEVPTAQILKEILSRLIESA